MKHKKGIDSLIDLYNVELEYADFSEEESYVFEDLTIPIRLHLQNFPKALDKIIEADKKLIQGYEAMPKGYFKDILKEGYLLAKQNVEAHQDAA